MSTRAIRRTAAAALACATAFSIVSGCVPANSRDVVAIAAQQEGKPYQWGGTGPYSFDCSGLVQYVFRLAGRNEPRTAQDQYNASLHISAFQTTPGDLVFYGAPWGVYHVGIYVGGGQMIDAPHTGAYVRQEQVWPGASFGRPWN